MFEDSEALILSFREGVPQWDMFPGPTDLRLIWFFDRINLDPKIQIKCIDTKIQVAHILTKRKFHAWWVESSVVFVQYWLFQFYSLFWSDGKKQQPDSGEERVTAKSRPMMSLVARAPSNLSFSTSESSGQRSYGNQHPWSAKVERESVERRNPLWAATQEPRLVITTNNLLKALSQHATRSGMITKFGLLESGKLTKRWVIERSNPLRPLGEKHTSPNQVSFMRRPSTME